MSSPKKKKFHSKRKKRPKYYLYSEEAEIKGSEFVGLFEINEKTPHYIAVAAKSLCFIETSYKRASGFLIKFMKNNEDFCCLMTNEHIVEKELVENKESIIFYYDNKKERREIILDKGNRYIKHFKNDLTIDATVVEILPEDNIPNDYFLIPDNYYMNNFDKLKGKEITILQYPSEIYKDAKYSTGKLIEIFGDDENKYEFSHLASTLHGSSGSPIFLKIDSVKIIGIHKSGSNLKNFGDFIGPIYEYFKYFYQKIYKSLDLPIINIKMKDGFGKYIYENGDYYEGKWKNYLRNGVGKLFNKNGEIIYVGEWVNDKREGFGISYYENGKTEYDGDWVNDKKEGKGTLYYENGKIEYFGDWVNDRREGKGTLCYENGKIEYDGDWVNDKREGFGRLYYENGEIEYFGDWVNDIKQEQFQQNNIRPSSPPAKPNYFLLQPQRNYFPPSLLPLNYFPPSLLPQPNYFPPPLRQNYFPQPNCTHYPTIINNNFNGNIVINTNY